MKRNKTSTFFLLALIMLSANGLFAQYTEMYWRTLDMRHGLPFPAARCLLEDRMGFMWIGTGEGLCRFDGSHFTIFRHDSTDAESLVDNSVMKLQLDLDGNIIIGTNEGVSLFDYKTGKFESHKIDIDGHDAHGMNWIRGICVWPDQHIWLATLDGTVDWNRLDGTFSLLDSTYDVSSNVLGNPVIIDHDGRGCWMALKGKVAHYDYQARQFSYLPLKTPHQEGNPATIYIEGFTRDYNDRIWYSSLGDSAMYCYDPSTGKEQSYRMVFEVKGNVYAKSIVNLFCDSENQIWISSWNESMRILDPVTGAIRAIESRNNDPFHMPISVVSDVYESKNHEIWVAHLGGISIHSRAMEAAISFDIPTSEISDNANVHIITCLNEDVSNGSYLVGTDGAGLYAYDGESMKSEAYRITGEPEITNGILCTKWIDNELWCGTWGGVHIFNTHTKTFRRFRDLRDEDFQSDGIAVIDTFQNEVWMSCWSHRIYVYDRATKQFRIYSNRKNDPASYPDVYTPHLLVDDRGTVWMGHREGYSWLEHGSEEFHTVSVFNDRDRKYYWNRSVGLLEDSERNIWFTSKGAGVFRIDPVTHAYERIRDEEFIGPGYPSVLALDKNKDIWFGSATGLIRYDHKGHKFIRFNLDQNVSASVLHTAGIITHTGSLLFSGGFDLIKVDPEAGISGSSISPPLISTADGGGMNWLNLQGYIFLARDQNNFTFHFSSPSDASRDDIEYRYQLVGIDDDWIFSESRTAANYNDIAGGNYEFRVSARVRGGEWIDSLKPLSVKVQRQIVETTLFRTTVVLAIITLGILVYVLRKKANARRARQRALQYFVNSSHTQSVSEICWDIARNCIDKLGFEDCVVYLKDAHRAVLIQVAAFSPNRPDLKELDSPLEVAMGSGIVGTVGATGKSERIGDTSKDARYILDDELRYSELAVPIVHEGQVIGVLDSEHKRRYYFSREDEKALEAIAAVCASKIANARAAKEVEEKEAMLAQINSMLSESQLVSLRAQMNPHFVFNCLNSIQESIMMKQYADASLYLNKFSRLFRLVLQNSSKNLITLSEEMNVLNLYLELEHMRFQNSFEYSMTCADDLDTEEIMIPSMLLQPFVENALWHGLMHKPGERRLWIRFYSRNDELFVCEIEDNGIGRAQSALIKKNKAMITTYESKGISISMDRLNLINLKQNKHATVDIIDLKSGNGDAAGTKVVFELSQFLN